MNIHRVALITFHACPLAAPGEGKAGGMNVHTLQLARGLGDLGVQVDVFTRDHPGAAASVEEVSPQVRVVHLPGGAPETPLEELYASLPEFLEAVREFWQQRRWTYQAVHSHYWLSGWVGQRLAQDWEVPHIITFHTLSLIKTQARAGEMEPIRRQEVEGELMASAHRIIAFSPHERDAMVRLYGADVGKIQLVPGGVDLELFRPLDRQEARAQLGLNGSKVLLCVSRVEPLKGLELLVHTATQLETCQEVRVLVVGSDASKGQEIDRLRQLARDLRVDEVFDFVGRVDHHDLPLYYNAADVCVVPSYYESFGLAALESMACGTPVVASRVGGLPTIVHHGRTGYLKSWRCPEAFASSLEMIMSSARLQWSMGRAARRRAEAMGWDKVAARLVQLYGSLAGAPLQTPPEAS